MKIIPLERYRPKGPVGGLEEARRTVREIIVAVERHGDAALRKFSRRYDRVVPRRFRVEAEEIAAALEGCPRDLRRAMVLAAGNLRRFARRQMRTYRDFSLCVAGGVTAGQRVLPIERIGVYVPGGRFPLFSSLLMAAVPARVAGVKEIAVFSPPAANGRVAAPVLAAAGLFEIKEVYALGGAQAVAAMACGSESVPAVDKIVGPGNCYVNLAKLAVFGKVGIDLPAGPSEIVILADGRARPEWIAADLLAQAEHDPLAIALLVTTSKRMAANVRAQVRKQLRPLPPASPAHDSIEKRGAILLASSLEKAIDFINRQAPEHLELQVKKPEQWARRCTAFGSLFIGSLAAEALGDYSSGLNHILPTAGAARFGGGLSVRDFLRLSTTLWVGAAGLRRIGPVARRLAEAENLAAHAHSLDLRLQTDGARPRNPGRFSRS
ncbi:MAG: histidinol dehydrogenase [Candidatus Aminicenantes bacterium]|nr:histidinol dehydrogenase [Candidatus Aminicenantes bacterium]